jgi:hypothetical protein
MFAVSGLKIVVSSYGVLLLLTLLSAVLATPVSSLEVSLEPRDDEFHTRAEDFYLRIMPLGASITKEVPTAPGLKFRGYRKFLRDQLRGRGWKVNMFGSQSSGEDSNDNAGFVTFYLYKN